MRSFLFASLVVFVSLPALAARPPINALTPEEAAASYELLFDGHVLNGLTIDGDYEIKDGLLVLGGTRPTQLRFPNLGRQFFVHLDFLAEGPAQVVVTKNSMFSSGMTSTTLGQSKDNNAWNGITLQQQIGGPDQKPMLSIIYDQVRWGGATGNGTLMDGDISLMVSPGGKLSLRNIKHKTIEAESRFGILSLYALLLTLFLVLVGTSLAVHFWRRRRRRPVLCYERPGPSDARQ